MLVRKRSIWRITHRNEASLSWLVAREKSFAAHSLNAHGVTIGGARKRVVKGVAKGVLGGDLPGGQSPANLFLRMRIVQMNGSPGTSGNGKHWMFFGKTKPASLHSIQRCAMILTSS